MFSGNKRKGLADDDWKKLSTERTGAAKVTTSFLLVINPPGEERLRCK